MKTLFFKKLIYFCLSAFVLISCGRSINDCSIGSNGSYCTKNFNLDSALSGIIYKIETARLLDGDKTHYFQGECNIEGLNIIFESEKMSPDTVEALCEDSKFKTVEKVIFLTSISESITVDIVLTNGPLIKKEDFIVDVDFNIPTISVTYPFLINPGSNDIIEGGCSDDQGTVTLTGPFAGSPITTPCTTDKIFTTDLLIFDSTSGTFSIVAEHEDRLGRIVDTEVQLVIN